MPNTYEEHIDTKRLNKLFQLLPFYVRHRWGGDEQEFREGIDKDVIPATEALREDNLLRSSNTYNVDNRILVETLETRLKNANERIASQRDEIGSAIRNSIILKTCLKKIRSVLEENSGRYARDDFYKDLDRLTEFVLEILDGEDKADLIKNPLEKDYVNGQS